MAVITVLEREQRAVLHILGLAETRTEQLSQDIQFTYGNLQTEPTGHVLSVAVFCTRQSGNAYMAAVTTLIHASLLPRLSVLVGICAGLQSGTTANGSPIKGVRIGAVLVPKNVWDFSFGVLKVGENLKEVLPRNEMHPVGTVAERVLLPAEKQMVRKIRDEYMKTVDKKWGTDRFEFSGPGDQTPDDWNKFLNEHVVMKDVPVSDHMIASSNWLLRDQNVLVDLYGRDDRNHGAEMESAGFAGASNLCRAKCIVVKGVSDFGTAKGDEFQHLASANAAAYLAVFLRNKLDPASLSDNAANLRRYREERAERQIKAVLEAFASLLQDKFALPINLEIYWIGRHRHVVSGEWERGVLRDGHLRAERAGALNRFEPRRFFAFLPKEGEPRAVARCGDSGQEVFHKVASEENIPLKWVYAVPVFSKPDHTGEVQGVICCTSTQSLHAGVDALAGERERLKLKATIGLMRDLLMTTFLETDVFELARREVVSHESD